MQENRYLVGGIMLVHSITSVQALGVNMEIIKHYKGGNAPKPKKEWNKDETDENAGEILEKILKT